MHQFVLYGCTVFKIANLFLFLEILGRIAQTPLESGISVFRHKCLPWFLRQTKTANYFSIEMHLNASFLQKLEWLKSKCFLTKFIVNSKISKNWYVKAEHACSKLRRNYTWIRRH